MTIPTMTVQEMLDLQVGEFVEVRCEINGAPTQETFKAVVEQRVSEDTVLITYLNPKGRDANGMCYVRDERQYTADRPIIVKTLKIRGIVNQGRRLEKFYFYE